jgi:YbbR domain-containing protein
LAADLSFSPGYHLKSPIQLSPDSISISGPESLVSNIMDWRTDSLILKDIQNSAEKKISLRESAREIKLNQQTITAKLEVEQFTEKSFFVKILQRNAPDSIRIFPDRIKIYCLVGLSKYEEVEESGFTVEVDLKDAKPGVENNAVPILLTKSPDFVDNVRFSPKSAEYIFIKKVEEEKSPSPTE